MSHNFDHRITINQGTPTTNDYNETTLVFSPYITVWASRRDASAGESYKAREVGGEISARFTIRYSDEAATITNKDTLTLENGKTYEITGVRETERNKYIEIDCVTRADK